MYIESIDVTIHLDDVVAEEKKYRQLQYDAEWNDEDASFYKAQANSYKKLIQQGFLYNPKF